MGLNKLLWIGKGTIYYLYISYAFQKSDTPQQAEHTYELLYNTGCRLAAEGQYIEAKVKLQAAEKLCRSSLEEDGLTEDEILDELAIIKWVLLSETSHFWLSI